MLEIKTEIKINTELASQLTLLGCSVLTISIIISIISVTLDP